MNTQAKEIAHLIEMANQVLLAKPDKPLGDHEQDILRHILMGKPLKTARAGLYSQDTIVKQIAPKLWKRLGEGVRAKTVRSFLEKVAEGQKLTQLASPLPINSAVSHLSTSPPPAETVTALDLQSNPHQGIPRRILHNLPQTHYSKFIGRKSEVDRLLKLLHPQHSASLICISGLGGVGKTSLALACAWRCLQASCIPDPSPSSPVFDLIIFATAKQQFLSYNGFQNRLDSPQKDLIDQIIAMLDRNNLITDESPALTFEAKVSLIYKVLSRHRTLLLLDNLEVVENKQMIEDFLCDLPGSVKSITTTREGINGNCILRLTVMSEGDGCDLVKQQAMDMGIVLSPEAGKALYQMTGGLPLAIHLVVGQLTKGYSLQRVQAQLLQPTDNLAQYCFAASVQSIQNQPAYWLLLATTLFPEPASRQALIEVAIPEIDPYAAEDELVHLQTLSLVSQETTATGAYSRYRVIAPTRAYVLAQLQTQPQFEQEVRKRWVDWYVKFSTKYREQDPTAWQGQFDGLDQEWENLLAVAQWCMDTNRYSELLQLWQNLKPYFYMVGRGADCMRFWSIGLSWAEWLVEAASHQQDWQTAGTVMFFRAWVLMGIDDPAALAEAETLLERAWNLRVYQDTLKDQANIARQIGLLNIKQQQFTQAQNWLQQSDEILQQATLDERKRRECLSYTRYYQGWAYFESGEMDAAKARFEEAHEYAQSISIDRCVQVIETFLADVAIYQKDFKRAKALLDKGLQIAEVKSDLRRTAAVKHSFAKLAQAEGNLTKMRREATESLQIFERLGMTTESKEVQALIDGSCPTKPHEKVISKSLTPSQDYA